MHLRARELAIGNERVDRPDHLELLRPLRAAEAVDIAPRVQIDLAPYTDRIERYLDLGQSLGRASFAPEIVVGRVLLDQQIEIAGLLTRMLAVGGMPVDDAVLVPPIAAQEIAEHSSLIDRGAIAVVHAVEGG